MAVSGYRGDAASSDMGASAPPFKLRPPPPSAVLATAIDVPPWERRRLAGTRVKRANYEDAGETPALPEWR